MDRLNKHPDLTIAQVANMYGIEYNKLRDEQLQWLRSNLKRDSPLWDEKSYGR